MRSLLALLATLALAGGCRLAETAEAEPAHSAQHRQQIQSISLDGRSLPMASLRALLETQVGDSIDIAKLQHDRVALTASLEARGYLAAKVQPAKITYDDGAYVTFAIEQGPLFRVRTVTVSGATEKDAGVVTISAGEIVTADRIRIAREALVERLGVRGKTAAVSADVHLDPAAAVVDIDFVATR